MVIVALPGVKRVYVYIIIAMFFIHGLSTAAKVTAGYCMSGDFLPEKYQSAMGTFLFVNEGLIYILLTIYYSEISKNWIYPQIFGLL